MTLFSDCSNYSKLADTGYSKPYMNLGMKDKGEITDTLIDFQCTLKVKAGMDQFSLGVKAVGLTLEYHSQLLKPLFTYTPSSLTAGKHKRKFHYM